MNGQRILALEWAIAIAFVSWFAIKNKFWPYPPTLVKLSAGFAVFGLMGMAAPEVSAALAGGFLIAGFLRLYQNGLSNYMGGIQPSGTKGVAKDNALTIPLSGEGK